MKTEKIHINFSRLQWCFDHYNVETLPKKLSFVEKKLEQENPSFTMRQLEDIAHFFGRSLTFFINPNEVKEEKIFSLQFRTLNNQKNNLSIKIQKLIERVEKQREIFISILEDLEEPIIKDWTNYKNINDPLKIRKWLCLDENNDFDTLRKQIAQGDDGNSYQWL